MPFGAVFTSSAGGDIGGGRLYTRLRGPLLMGAASTAEPGGQTLQSTANLAGSAAQPMYSYYLRPDTGQYASNVTTSASDIRWTQAAVDVLSFTSGAVAMISTAAGTTQPSFVWNSSAVSHTTQATDGFIYLPASTETPAGAGVATPTSRGFVTAALSFDVTNKKLWMYTTVSSWIGLGASTSGATLWTTSS